jgi:hypothetical protein
MAKRRDVVLFDANGEVGNGTTTTAEKPVEIATGATQVSSANRDVVITTTKS